MATREEAREKFVTSVTSPLAVRKMTSKLSTYLGIPVNETSGPVQEWVRLMRDAAGDVFDKAYANMHGKHRNRPSGSCRRCSQSNGTH